MSCSDPNSPSSSPGQKLKQASEQQKYYRTVKDIDLWLDEVEKQLGTEDLGKVGCVGGVGKVCCVGGVGQVCCVGGVVLWVG